jgi:hypothetical protein
MGWQWWGKSRGTRWRDSWAPDDAGRIAILGELDAATRNDNVYVIIEKCSTSGNIDADGRSPFAKWLRALNAQAAAKVAAALERMAT